MNEAISSLLRYSLVDSNDDMLSVHRYVQSVTRNNMDDDEISIRIGSLIQTFYSILPKNTYNERNRDIYVKLEPHLSSIIRLALVFSIKDENINNDIRSTISKLGTFLFKTSDYKKHIEYQKKCFRLCKNIGKIGDLIGMAECITKIGTDYNWLANYNNDIKFQEICLRFCKKICDRQEEDDFYINLGVTQSCLNNFLEKIEADCYINLGKANHNLCLYKDAKENYKICLDIYKKIKTSKEK